MNTEGLPSAALGPNSEFKIMRALFFKKKGQAVLLGALAVMSAVATLALPMFVGKLIGTLREAGGVTAWALLLVAVGLGSALAGAGANYLLSRLGLHLVRDLRVSTMNHSLRLTLLGARKEGAGNLTTRLTMDAARLKSVVDIGPIQLPMAGITITGTLVVMGVIDWVLLLATLGAFVIAVGMVGVVVVRLRRRYIAAQQELGGLAQQFVAAMNALTVVKAHRAEESVSKRLAARADRVAKLDISAAKMESLMPPVVNFSQQVALVTVVIVGGARMIDGVLSLGSFVAFLIYLLQLTAPLIMAASGVGSLQIGLAARKRFDALFGMEREPAEPEEGRTPTSVDAGDAVTFDRVSFSYDEVTALDDAGFTVPRRGITAIVGPSGSGKTTTLGLIERFMSPTTGTVTVLGHDSACWRLDELRGRVAYVDQTATLLEASVRDNLTIGQRTERSDEELYAALAEVGLADDVRSLSTGLDTWLGGGSDMSGGQRQRVALARAILSESEVVLLDEPSSQLDSVNEAQLRDSIDRLAENRAVVVVTHRMSTVGNARHVVFFDHGAVLAEGTHDELASGCEPYRELIAGQLIGIPDAVVA